MATSLPSYPPLTERPLKNTICLFDVDGTLTPARLVSYSSKIIFNSLTTFQLNPS